MTSKDYITVWISFPDNNRSNILSIYKIFSTTYLCKNDEEKISEAKSISEKALLSRISLWDGIENEIKTKYKYYEKV